MTIDMSHGPLARYVNLRVARAPGMPGTFSLPSQVRDPDMHHGTCVTHVPSCMMGSLSIEVGSGENVPGIPGACATRNFTYLVRGPLWNEQSVMTSSPEHKHARHGPMCEDRHFVHHLWFMISRKNKILYVLSWWFLCANSSVASQLGK